MSGRRIPSGTSAVLGFLLLGSAGTTAATPQPTCERGSLRVLVASGMPAKQATAMLDVARLNALRRFDTCAVARTAATAYRRGASSQEMVNLTGDVLASGIRVPTTLILLEAMGRLAEEGFTDPETRRDLESLAREVQAAERRGPGARKPVDEVRWRMRRLRQSAAIPR
jgi:hypothetical protein